MTALAFALLLPLVAAPVAEASFSAGVAAYEAKDYKKAYDEWIVLARKNDPAAMRNIGHLYRRGLGVEQDYQKAMTWYKRAATLGLDRAQANVAGMYLAGEGVEQDYAQAANWFAQAAQQGHVISQYNLALLLENGLGVRKDERMALGWFAIAAEAGHPESARRAAALSQKLNITAEEALNMSGEIVLTPKEKEKKGAEASPAPEPEFPPKPAPAVSVKAPAPEKAPENAGKPIQKKGFYDALRALMGGGDKPAGDASIGATAAAAAPDAPAAFESETETQTETETRTETETAVSTASLTPSSETPAPAAPSAAAVKPAVAAVPQGKVTTRQVPPPMPQVAPGAAAYGDGLSTKERLEMASLAYKLKDYQTSLGIWAQLAEEGNADAQYHLGALFNAGQAVPKDRVRAYYWWDQARGNGSAEAASALAELEPTLTYHEKRQIDRSD